MTHTGENKDWLIKQINHNTKNGLTTAIEELSINQKLEGKELYCLLDELVDNQSVQWTSEEQLISLPLPSWYAKRLEEIKRSRYAVLNRNLSF